MTKYKISRANIYLLCIIIPVVWLVVYLVFIGYQNLHKAQQADESNQQMLFEMGKKSEAHRYFSNNWKECSAPAIQCLASIRSMAAIHGAVFVGQVDSVMLEAAKELGFTEIILSYKSTEAIN